MDHILMHSEPLSREPTAPSTEALYRRRRLAQGYPSLDQLAFERFCAVVEEHGDETSRIETLLSRLDNLVDLSQLRNVVVIGCGPKPQPIRLLRERNHNVVGVEPVPSFVEAARDYLGSAESVLEGAAEAIPLPDCSQQVVFCYSVLEHVVSPSKSLNEMFRVLAPGGIAVITTTNKFRISLGGHNGEYRVRFFNWLPDLVKECFVFQHLHYTPALANYSELPAVHWFSYASLCALGRQAGFARFYSVLDLMDQNEPAIRKSKLRKWLLNRLKFNPWLRALALTQRGDTIIMLKLGAQALAFACKEACANRK
jgi:SAM-dependent methyltransferase